MSCKVLPAACTFSVLFHHVFLTQIESFLWKTNSLLSAGLCEKQCARIFHLRVPGMGRQPMALLKKRNNFKLRKEKFLFCMQQGRVFKGETRWKHRDMHRL